MFPRRIAIATVIAVLASALTLPPTLAARPIKQPSSPLAELPLTPEEQAAADAKLAAADAYLARVASSGSDLASLNCVTPTAATHPVSGTVATEGETDAAIQGCYTPQGFLSVEARDQVKNIYCGPAVGQVIANYSWAMSSGRNKYTQRVIAGWMATDANGGTNAHLLEHGLERATAGSPRRPANWDWVVFEIRDRDGDGTTGDQLHDVVRSNVSGSRMPVAIPVKPHDPNSRYYLVSWPRPVWSVGHWIAAYGWVGLWNGTDYSRLYYTDSSRDEGGSTGKFWDPMRHVAALIQEHTRRVVW